jgi:hypothetical protein
VDLCIKKRGDSGECFSGRYASMRLEIQSVRMVNQVLVQRRLTTPSKSPAGFETLLTSLDCDCICGPRFSE